MTRTLGAVISVLLLGSLAMGQADGRPSKRFELFGGFSWISQDISLTNPNGTGPIGWNASITFPQPHSLGVVVDVSGFYPSYSFGCGSSCSESAKIHSFLAGPQISASHGRVRPFARFLIGDTYMNATYGNGGSLQTFTSHNSFTFGAGGGVDVNLNHRLAWRAQVDWLHNGFMTSDNQRTYQEHHNAARLSTGIVIRF